MNVESSRDAELFWHHWSNMPVGLSMDEAYRYFVEKIKPSGYKFDRFRYDRKTGRCRTL